MLGIDCDLLQIEWDLLKSQVYERFCTQLGMMKLEWKQVSNALRREAPNILDLIDLILTIPAS